MAAPAPRSSNESNGAHFGTTNRPLTRNITTDPQSYPCGPCNFRDLFHGNSSASCGCRQFWLNDVSQILFGDASHGSRNNTSQAECFCGHHACFHEREPAMSSQIAPGAEIGGAIRINGSAVFSPHSSSQHQSAHRVEHLGNDVPGPRSISSSHSAQGNLEPLFRQPYKQNRSAGILTQGARAFIGSRTESHSKTEQAGLGLYWGSKAPSRASSHRATSVKSPPARAGATSQVGLGFQPSPRHFRYNLVPQLHENAANLDTIMLAPDNNADDFAQSVTEVATPSNAGTPAFRAPEDGFLPTMHDAGNATGGAMPTTGDHTSWNQKEGHIVHTNEHHTSEPETALNHIEISILKHLLGSTPNLGTSLRNLSKRLEALETTSFSHVSEQAVQDVLENFEVRLIELTTRLEDLESTKWSFNQDARDYAPHTITPQPPGGGIAAATLERLGERLKLLESVAPPTLGQPWEVEVVLLPWGRHLKGVWLNQEEASQASRAATQESSNRSMKRSISQSHHSNSLRQSQAAQDWKLSSEDWLLPKACGATQGLGGKVYERLSSRGFVRQAKFFGRDASSIYAAILSAFEDLFDELDNSTGGQTKDSASQSQDLPLGLRSDFVPLRKVHKSSVLRFLSPAELATPSLWNADFLDSSVLMKAAAGRKKLFITQASAYIQSKESRKSNWNWQKLREMPRFVSGSIDAEGSNPSFVGEADAREPCWMFDARLDETPSVQSSFTSSHKDSSKKGSFVSSHPPSPEQTLHDALLSDSGDDSAVDELSVSQQSVDPLQISSSPSRRHSPITPLSEAIPLPEIHQSEGRRTFSLPLAEPDPPTTPKRQAASFEQTSSPIRPDKQQQLKRRRLSRDAEDIAGNGVRGPGDNMTPRRSREPPSPHQSETTMEIRANWFDRRATTPSAYATPFSNNVVVGWMGSDDESMDDDGDDEQDDGNNEDDESVVSLEEKSGNEDTHANDEDVWAGLDEDSEDDEADEYDDDSAHIEAAREDYYDDANDHHGGVI